MESDDGRAALYAYTLGRGDAAFIHQHAVDALCAQKADVATPPIRLAFALVGLHLRVERGYTGRQVQRVHAMLADRATTWPVFELPASRGEITIQNVLAAPEGPERDAAIDAWCASVWSAYKAYTDDVVGLLRRYGVG